MAAKKPAKKMSMSRDMAMDKKMGIKQGSKRDVALDRKRGVMNKKMAATHRAAQKKGK
jgi:hypothetical protein